MKESDQVAEADRAESGDYANEYGKQTILDCPVKTGIISVFHFTSLSTGYHANQIRSRAPLVGVASSSYSTCTTRSDNGGN